MPLRCAMDGKLTVEAPNRAWLKLLRASLYLLHGHETKGPRHERCNMRGKIKPFFILGREDGNS